MMHDQFMSLVEFLTPDYRKDWARAMRAEISIFDNNRDATVFVLGCMIACLRFHLAPKISTEKAMNEMMKDKFTIATFISGMMACLIGLSYLLSSGAPLSMMAINGAAVLLAILLVIAVKISVRSTTSFLTAIAVFGALCILATAIFGSAVTDARRWLMIGPFFIQTSLIFLPLIALSFARVQNLWTTLAVFVASFAIAFQPDRAMAAMLFLAVSTVCWMRPNKLTFGASIFCTLGLISTLLSPEHLPAVPFVDHILWTAFEIDFWVGASLWFGCLLLLCPILFVPIDKRTAFHYTFVACWFAVVAASAIGAYPTPMVGYGASAILGYFLSTILVESGKLSQSNEDVTFVASSDNGDDAFSRRIPGMKTPTDLSLTSA